MRNILISAQTGIEAYRELLGLLANTSNRHVVRSEDMHSEIIGCTLYIDQADTLDFEFAERGGTAYKYTEALWDLGPSDDITVLKNVNPYMQKFVQDQPEGYRDTANWAYGPQVHKELLEVAEHLVQNPSSRRACISMPRTIRTIGTPPCLASIQFFVRPSIDFSDGWPNGIVSDKLHCVVYMRSNDVWLGVPLDVFQFSLIQRLVAGYIGLPMGTYQHFVGSMHLYERDLDLAKESTRYAAVQHNMSTVWSPKELCDVHDGFLAKSLYWASKGVYVPIAEGFNEYLYKIAKYVWKKAGWSGECERRPYQFE